MKKIDMTGWIMKEHGVPESRWTVIEEDIEYSLIHATDGYRPYWKCQCECGNIKSVLGKALRNGRSLSCGCLREERIAEFNNIEIIGNRYGKLVVIKFLYKDKRNQKVYLCQCDCGNTIEVIASSLLTGNTSSCGCLKSKGEYIINTILSSNNITFTTQKTYPDLVSPNNHLLKFDYYINNNFLLEYDGTQHFAVTGGWNASEEELEKRKEYDLLKDEYAKSHNIPLKRIPYWDYDQITLENIMSDKWIINN